MRTWAVWALAVASVAASAYLLSAYDASHMEVAVSSGRRLQAVAGPAGRHHIKWSSKHTAALVLSVLVSLTSSLDRGCGSTLYVVLFAVLLNMSFRKAAAMTAFTVALGALAPGIAGMSEARLTERGVLPIVDYPGALLLLPTMFWGISFGTIVNLWFPNWLLALIWVIIAMGSNAELAFSFVRYIQVKKQAAAIGRQLRAISPDPTSDVGADTEAALNGAAAQPTAAAAGVAGSSSNGMVPHKGVASSGDNTGGAAAEERRQLLNQAQQLAKQAHRIEACALLYPTLYVPDVGRALQKAKVNYSPCALRATATPSCLDTMGFEQQALAQELASYQQVFDRFTFSWHKWWFLNRIHFEMAMVLKIVVLHLVTEAVRHHTSKPCTTKFWFMLCVMTGLVTAFLLFTVISYAQKRLWRGPHWIDALDQTRQVKKEQQQHELQQLADLTSKDPARASPGAVAAAPAAQNMTAASAAVATGEACAVQVAGSAHGSTDGMAAVMPGRSPAAAAAAAADDSLPRQQQEGQSEEEPGCCLRCKKKLPWFWAPATDAVSVISYCNSYNQYKNWRTPLALICAAVTFPIGILGCALGLPGGPLMAQLLLFLGLKPEVVAGTSRFLVLCFTFGSFVAHIIAGSLEPTLAAAFGLLNLGLAPLGMFLITKMRPRAVAVIGLSLLMGVAGVVTVTVWQLVPLMGHMVADHTGNHVHLPTEIGYATGVNASLLARGNNFDLGRFCRHNAHQAGHA